MKSSTKFLTIIFIAFFTLSSCSYKSNFVLKKYMDENPDIYVNYENSFTVVAPETETDVGLIFYPGAYVNYDAYLPLMIKCAEKGIKCFLVKMPADLAILNVSAAKNFPNKFPEIKNWYIAGHSLGGAMAASFVSKNTDDFKGLILLAAYSTADLSNSKLKVLSVYGSSDGVLSSKKYSSNKKNLPEDFEEHILDGGNHANFGSYGFQKGDNEATMDAETQKNLTADFIGNFCFK